MLEHLLSAIGRVPFLKLATALEALNAVQARCAHAILLGMAEDQKRVVGIHLPFSQVMTVVPENGLVSLDGAQSAIRYPNDPRTRRKGFNVLMDVVATWQGTHESPFCTLADHDRNSAIGSRQ